MILIGIVNTLPFSTMLVGCNLVHKSLHQTDDLHLDIIGQKLLNFLNSFTNANLHEYFMEIPESERERQRETERETERDKFLCTESKFCII